MKHGKIHYCWIICFGCALLMFVCSGLIIGAFSVYMPHIISEHGYSNTQISLITTMRSLFGLGAKIVSLWVIRKISLRYTCTVACVLEFIAFFLYSQAANLPVYYMAAALSGIGYGLGSMVSVSILLHRWFEDKLPLVLGICAASTGVTTFVCPPILTSVIIKYGLSKGFLVVALFNLVVSILIFFLLRNSPEEMGLQPYGHNKVVKAEHERAIDTEHPTTVIGKGTRIAINVVPILIGCYSMTAGAIFALHFTVQGYDVMTISTAISLNGLALIVGKLAFGFFSSNSGSFRTSVLFMAISILGTMVCAFARIYDVFMFTGTIVCGIGLAISTVGISVIAADFAAPGEYDKMVRRFQVMYAAGGLAFSPITGFLADITKSYTPVFLVYSAMCAIVLVILLSSYRSKHRYKPKIL